MRLCISSTPEQKDISPLGSMNILMNDLLTIACTLLSLGTH